MAKANQAVQPEIKTEEKVDLDFTKPETTPEVVTTAAPVPAPTKEQIAATQKAKLTELVAKYGTKSQMIRALKADGMKTADIARLTGLRYQHVRNVLMIIVKTPKVVVPAVVKEEVKPTTTE